MDDMMTSATSCSITSFCCPKTLTTTAFLWSSNSAATISCDGVTKQYSTPDPYGCDVSCPISSSPNKLLPQYIAAVVLGESFGRLAIGATGEPPADPRNCDEFIFWSIESAATICKTEKKIRLP